MRRLFPFNDDRLSPWAVLLLLVAGAFALYANTFSHAWTYDDFVVIVENPDVRSWRAFFENSYPGRPLRELTYLFDHLLFGLNPAGWHIQNIFWHGLNASLLFVLVRRLGGEQAVAWIASLLFLVHPLQVEVVANISHRKDSLALAFCFFSLLAYIEASQSRTQRLAWLAAAALLGFVALLAKQNALVLAPVFLAYEWVYLPPERRMLARKPLLLIVPALIGIVSVLSWFFVFGGYELFLATASQTLAHGRSYYGEVGAATYFAMVLKSWAFMLSKLFWPFGLAVEYFHAVPHSWLDPWIVASLIFVLLLGAGLRWSFRRSPLLFFALCWFSLFWLPTANIWPLAYYAADRYLYAPSVGLFVLIALFLHRWLKQARLQISVSLAITSLLVVLTWQQSQIWRSDETLLQHALAVSPGSVVVRNELGKFYDKKGDVRQAIIYYEQAVATDPKFAAAQYNLASVYEQLGMKDKALKHYACFIKMDNPAYRSETRALVDRLSRQYGDVFRGYLDQSHPD